MTNKSQDNFENRLFDGSVKLISMASTLLWHGAVKFFTIFARDPLRTSILTALMISSVKIAANYGWHIKLLVWAWPSLFSGKFLTWLLHFSVLGHFYFLFGNLVFCALVLLGGSVIRERKRYQQYFEGLGMTSGMGGTPKLIAKQTIDQHREKYVFKSSGVGFNRFKEKQAALETIFQKPIESIKHGRNPSFIEVVTSTKELGTYFGFDEAKTSLAGKRDSFVIGDSLDGILTAKLADLPHLLIAGTTGGGKSVFFKQVILGLMETGPNLQVYFIDLKRGLEAADFANAPNVVISKNAFDALQVLEQIQMEMDRRFKYLESRGNKTIDPKRDKMDRIVVAVDEAGELYADRSKFDEDFETCQKAQKITNSFARLGRAAGIHLILATQKVQKETINTVIQENISARMCFRMNTLQGSLQVLGSKEAMDLPAIPGRGIWQIGAKQVEVQVPEISGEMIREACQHLKNDFQNGSRWCLQPMLTAKTKKTGDAPPVSLVDYDA